MYVEMQLFEEYRSNAGRNFDYLSAFHDIIRVHFMILVSCLCSSFRELLAVTQTLTNKAEPLYSMFSCFRVFVNLLCFSDTKKDGGNFCC